MLAAFETPFKDARVEITGPEGDRIKPVKERRGGGPPFWVEASFEAAGPGRYALTVLKDKREAVAAGFEVAGEAASGSGGGRRGVWQNERGWSRPEENLYSAWLEALFLDCDERASWDSLHAAMRDRDRNVLFDALGLGEDDAGGKNAVEMTPDCADNPFYLRAYFAWKMGLPFGFHQTSWGGVGVAPRSEQWFTNETVSGGGGSGPRAVEGFRRLLPRVADVVHAGNGRTAFGEDDADYYPLPLTRNDLRPGAVFADPYGHTLTVVRWVPQTGRRPGLLLAVDAQPDGTIGIKRFWQGNFLFETEGVVGEPGFKAFRPIIVEKGRERLLTNAEIGASPDYGNLSLMQEKMAPRAFYGTMERLINPDPLDAEDAFRDLYQALHEQLIVRVESVGNGVDYADKHPGTIIPMPAGGEAVFQTTGLWEDFSTPNRDLRLLIAIDTILAFPEKAAADRAAFGIPARKSAEDVRAELGALGRKWGKELTITYTRSDGTPQVLSVADILERREALEMAYNPNDGPEIRWGAPERSAERSSCRRRAPAYQLDRMKAMRVWFQKRLHPPT